MTSERPVNSPRPRPYVWVSWIKGLLADTDKCAWRAWMQAHYRYAKLPGDGSGSFLKEWTRQHDAMTEDRVRRLRAEGYEVKVEDENAFKLEGRGATLAGKPDIVALNRQEKRAFVVDEKSGKERESDVWQVLLYLFALPLIGYDGWTITGEVEYRGSAKFIPAERIHDAKPKIINVMKIVSAAEEPPRSPSAAECQFCDIATCPDRYKDRTVVANASDYF